MTIFNKHKGKLNHKKGNENTQVFPEGEIIVI